MMNGMDANMRRRVISEIERPGEDPRIAAAIADKTTYGAAIALRLAILDLCREASEAMRRLGLRLANGVLAVGNRAIDRFTR